MTKILKKITTVVFAAFLFTSGLALSTPQSHAFSITIGGDEGSYDEGGSAKDKILNFGLDMMKQAIEKNKGSDRDSEYGDEPGYDEGPGSERDRGYEEREDDGYSR